MADSLLSNILKESDASLDTIRCSFLSYLLESCWDVAIPGNECRPSVDKNMRQVSRFYREHCLPSSCFSIFSAQRGRPCAAQFEQLMRSMMHPDACHASSDGGSGREDYSEDDVTGSQGMIDDNGERVVAGREEREQQMTAFKACAESASPASCRGQTSAFIDLFMSHVQQHTRSC